MKSPLYLLQLDILQQHSLLLVLASKVEKGATAEGKEGISLEFTSLIGAKYQLPKERKIISSGSDSTSLPTQVFSL